VSVVVVATVCEVPDVNVRVAVIKAVVVILLPDSVLVTVRLG
jgi:hypothetical protein